MFKNLFHKKRDFAPDTKERMRAVASSSSAGLAASLLIAPTSLMQLTPDDALIVVSYMVPRKIPAGATFITEGDQSDTGYMLLLLEGEVMVEALAHSGDGTTTVTVIGPGGLVGELGLVDGLARLASCTASTDVLCGVLSRSALEELCEDEPGTAAKLMFAVSVRLAERLRTTTEKLKKHNVLLRAMQSEVDS